MVKAGMKWGIGTRAQVSVIWNTMNQGFWGNELKGHEFIAEYNENGLVFVDAQTGKYYNKAILEKVTQNPINYCRIDNLEIDDLGSTACRKG